MIDFEEKIGYIFRNKKLLEEALTHPSVKKSSKKVLSYQRLEFLGDKVLGFVIAETLIRKFPGEDEGVLSRRLAFLVCKQSLVLIANAIDLGSYLILSKGQTEDGGRENENILENAMEALIGGIFLDGGIDSAREFILFHFNHIITNLSDKNPPKDPKSAFQEWFQKKYGKIPEYKLVGEFDGEFVVLLEFKGKSFEGRAKSIKEAEKTAASKALKGVEHN